MHSPKEKDVLNITEDISDMVSSSYSSPNSYCRIIINYGMIGIYKNALLIPNKASPTQVTQKCL